MPRTAEENDRIRRETTELILETALSLFCEKGYYSTSIDNIAKQAEISKGLLYHYFKSKADVLAALVELRINDVLVVMNRAAAQKTPVEQIRYIVEGALADVRDQPDVFRFYLNLFTQPRLDPIAVKYTQKLMDEQARQFKVQTKMFEALGVENPQQRSLYFSATLQGVMLMYSTYPKSFPLSQVQAQIIAEFCSDQVVIRSFKANNQGNKSPLQ
jgi:AcrR family transcriptional regulator